MTPFQKLMAKNRLVPEFTIDRGVVYVRAWVSKPTSRKNRRIVLRQPGFVRLDPTWFIDHPQDREHAEEVQRKFFAQHGKTISQAIQPEESNV